MNRFIHSGDPIEEPNDPKKNQSGTEAGKMKESMEDAISGWLNIKAGAGEAEVSQELGQADLSRPVGEADRSAETGETEKTTGITEALEPTKTVGGLAGEDVEGTAGAVEAVKAKGTTGAAELAQGAGAQGKARVDKTAETAGKAHVPERMESTGKAEAVERKRAADSSSSSGSADYGSVAELTDHTGREERHAQKAELAGDAVAHGASGDTGQGEAREGASPSSYGGENRNEAINAGTSANTGLVDEGLLLDTATELSEASAGPGSMGGTEEKSPEAVRGSTADTEFGSESGLISSLTEAEAEAVKFNPAGIGHDEDQQNHGREEKNENDSRNNGNDRNDGKPQALGHAESSSENTGSLSSKQQDENPDSTAEMEQGINGGTNNTPASGDDGSDSDHPSYNNNDENKQFSDAQETSCQNGSDSDNGNGLGEGQQDMEAASELGEPDQGEEQGGKGLLARLFGFFADDEDEEDPDNNDDNNGKNANNSNNGQGEGQDQRQAGQQDAENRQGKQQGVKAGRQQQDQQEGGHRPERQAQQDSADEERQARPNDDSRSRDSHRGDSHSDDSKREAKEAGTRDGERSPGQHDAANNKGRTRQLRVRGIQELKEAHAKPEDPRQRKRDAERSDSLEESIVYWQGHNKVPDSLEGIKDTLTEVIGLGSSFDIVFREMTFGGRRAALFCVSGFAKDTVMDDILRRLTYLTPDNVSTDAFASFMNEYIPHIQVEKGTSFSESINKVLSGMSVLYIDGETQVIVMDTRIYPSRNPEEPSIERVVRGARDGFTETLLSNVALVRRRIRDPGLKFEMHQVGRRTRTDVAVAYIDDIVDKTQVKSVTDKIKSVNIDGIPLADKQLEEAIVGANWNPYPLVRYSERPDNVASHLLEGRIVIFVDTSPSVMVLPTTFFDLCQHAEENRQTPFMGSYLRWVRFLGIVASMFLLPLWMLMVIHPELKPAMLDFIGPQKMAKIPILAQFLIVELGVDLLRMAAVHTPTPLGSAMGLIAAILVGDIAVKTGLFVNEVVLYMAVASIGMFATPSYELGLANRIVRLVLLLAVAAFQVPGFMIGTTLLVLLLATHRSYNSPYLWPFIPFNAKAMGEILLRQPVLNSKTRPSFNKTRDNTRMPPTQKNE